MTIWTSILWKMKIHMANKWQTNGQKWFYNSYSRVTFISDHSLCWWFLEADPHFWAVCLWGPPLGKIFMDWAVCLTILTIFQRLPYYCVTNSVTLQIYCWLKELKVCTICGSWPGSSSSPALLHSLGRNLNINFSMETKATKMKTLLATKMSNGLNFTVLILLCNLLNLFSYKHFSINSVGWD